MKFLLQTVSNVLGKKLKADINVDLKSGARLSAIGVDKFTNTRTFSSSTAKVIN